MVELKDIANPPPAPSGDAMADTRNWLAASRGGAADHLFLL
jgi:hypothetical protein